VSATESVILGAIQGITEFLPISSSAHLIILPWFFRIGEEGVDRLAFDVMLHFGTLLAILSLYGKRFLIVVIDALHEIKEKRLRESLFFKIVMATIPAAIFGLLCKDYIESYLRTPYVSAISLIAVSIVMIVCERLYVSEQGITYPVAITIGLAQALALIPGTSRSGVTIAVGMLLGLRRSQAVDFSFMLSIPIILGTALYESRYLDLQSLGATEVYGAGVASAFVFGFLSLKFLIGFLKKHSLDVFALYRITIALLILLFSH
jgi:undecaprenyl-diphosphatase